MNEDLEFEMTAFNELSSDRSFGFGVGPIPWTSVDRYAVRYGIDDLDSFDRFVRILKAMDKAYRDNQEEKKPAK